MDRTWLSRSRFSPTWRACCLKVVQEYIRLKKERQNETVGSTKLANAMREPHKIKTPGKEWANAKLEEELTRQDIEAWLNRGTELSPLKFHFVSFFVQNLLKSEFGPELRQFIEEYRVEETAEALGHLYMLQKIEGGRKAAIEGFVGSLFSVGAQYDLSDRILLKCALHFAGVIFLRAIIAPKEQVPPADLVRNGRVLNGYFVPTVVEGYGGAKATMMEGVFVLQDPTLCNLLSSKTAFDSMALIRFVYQSGSLRVLFSSATVLAEFIPILKGAENAEYAVTFDEVENPVFDAAFAELARSIV